MIPGLSLSLPKDTSSSTNPYLRRETRPTKLWNTGDTLEAARQLVASSGEGETPKSLSNVIAKTAVANTNTAATVVNTMQANKTIIIGSSTLEQARERIRLRHDGIDPFAASKTSKRDKYLKKVCAYLPPIGSDDRERLRKGILLQNFLQTIESSEV